MKYKLPFDNSDAVVGLRVMNANSTRLDHFDIHISFSVKLKLAKGGDV